MWIGGEGEGDNFRVDARRGRKWMAGNGLQDETDVVPRRDY